MLRLQPSFGGSVEASHPHVKDHGVMIVGSAAWYKIGPLGVRCAERGPSPRRSLSEVDGTGRAV